jgi:hypothetical protein
VAPPPPPAPAPVVAHSTATPPRTPASLEAQLSAPGRIPTHIAMIVDSGPPSPPSSVNLGGSSGRGIPGGLDLGTSPPAVVVAKPPASKHPLAISSGVAAGQLLSPIQPVYPSLPGRRTSEAPYSWTRLSRARAPLKISGL